MAMNGEQLSEQISNAIDVLLSLQEWLEHPEPTWTEDPPATAAAILRLIARLLEKSSGSQQEAPAKIVH